MIDRRLLLKSAALAPLLGATSNLVGAATATNAQEPNHTLRIGTGLVELAPDNIIDISTRS